MSSVTTLFITHEGCSSISSEQSITLPGRGTDEWMAVCGLVSGSILTESSGTWKPEGITVRTQASGKTSKVIVNKILGGGIKLRGLRTDIMKQDQIYKIAPQNEFKINIVQTVSQFTSKPEWFS